MSDVVGLRAVAILELRIPGLSLDSLRLLRADKLATLGPDPGTADSLIRFVARLMTSAPFTDAICSALFAG